MFLNYAKIICSVQFSCSLVSDFLRPHESQHARPPCPSRTPGVHSNSCPLSRWCHPAIYPLLSPSPPAPIPPSIKVFSNESVLRIRWPKYWSFSISHSNEYSGLISFRMDWLDLLAGQGILKSLLQHHSSKESILRRSAFFTLGINTTSLAAQLVKNLLAMQETPVQFLGWEDPLEKGRATHSSILAWRLPWTV